MGEVISFTELGLAGTAGLAVAALAMGRVVILPTDTVYGLTAPVFRLREAARVIAGENKPIWTSPIQALYELKGRVLTQPAIILAKDWAAAAALTAQPLDNIRRFCARLDCPTTVVVRAKHQWGPPATDGPGTIALRVPNHVVLNLALRFAKFVFSASANLPGGKDPQVVADIPRELVAGAAFTIDAGRTPSARPSCIVDFTGRRPQVVRGDAAVATAVARWEL